MKHPIPIVAAILSFFIPGLGHIYAGYMVGGFYAPLGKATIKKGFYFAGGYLLAAALTSVIIGFLLLLASTIGVCITNLLKNLIQYMAFYVILCYHIIVQNEKGVVFH